MTENIKDNYSGPLIVMGIPFAGKSKFVSKLKNYYIINMRALKTEIFSSKVQDRKVVKAASFLIQNAYMYDKKINIVVVGELHRISQRKKIVQAFKRWGRRPRLVQVHRSSEDCLEERRHNKGVVSENEMLKIIGGFQTPTKDEGVSRLEVVHNTR